MAYVMYITSLYTLLLSNKQSDCALSNRISKYIKN